MTLFNHRYVYLNLKHHILKPNIYFQCAIAMDMTLCTCSCVFTAWYLHLLASIHGHVPPPSHRRQAARATHRLANSNSTSQPSPTTQQDAHAPRRQYHGQTPPLTRVFASLIICRRLSSLDLLCVASWPSGSWDSKIWEEVEKQVPTICFHRLSLFPVTAMNRCDPRSTPEI